MSVRDDNENNDVSGDDPFLRRCEIDDLLLGIANSVSTAVDSIVFRDNKC